MKFALVSNRLPPLSALRGFEAAARHQSFKQAAEELCLTQSAISHQVKLLEEFLGRQLFDRAPSGVTLNAAGATFLNDIQPIFEQLVRATNKALAVNAQRPLAVRCSPAFASRWLLPRLARAEPYLNGVEISLTTAAASSDDVETADVRINCGREVPPDAMADVLMTARRAPVCSPAFLTTHGRPGSPHDFLSLPLLRERSGDEWSSWLVNHTGEPVPHGRQAWFDDVYGTLMAAEQGLGIALGHLTLIAQELAEGRLVRLTEETTDRMICYTVTSPRNWEKDGRIVAFRSWLSREIDQWEIAFDRPTLAIVK